LKLDTSKQTLHDARAKPKLMTAHSESHLTVFSNGHHKPCHRNNNTAHVSGAPYKIPRPHTLHGHSAFAALKQGGSSYNSKSETPATRSMDTLSLSNTEYHAMFGSNQRSTDDLSATTMAPSMATSLEAAVFADSLFADQNSLFSQGSNSPSSNVSEPFSNQQWPWSAATVTPINDMFAFGSLSTSPSQDCLPNFGSEWSMPSAGFDPIWSAGDLPLNPSKFTDTMAQPISHSGESKQSGPGLTAASSVHSDVEANLFGDLDINAPQSTASEPLFWEDNPGGYHVASRDSFLPSASVPVTSASQVQVLDSDFTKGLSTTPVSMPTATINDFIEAAAIAMPSNLEDNISIDPWPIEQSTGAYSGLNGFELSYPNNWF
jgi:hypothetical protein